MIPGEMPIIKRRSQSACVDRPSEEVRGETFPPVPAIGWHSPWGMVWTVKPSCMTYRFNW